MYSFLDNINNDPTALQTTSVASFSTSGTTPNKTVAPIPLTGETTAAQPDNTNLSNSILKSTGTTPAVAPATPQVQTKTSPVSVFKSTTAQPQETGTTQDKTPPKAQSIYNNTSAKTTEAKNNNFFSKPNPNQTDKSQTEPSKIHSFFKTLHQKAEAAKENVENKVETTTAKIEGDLKTAKENITNKVEKDITTLKADGTKIKTEIGNDIKKKGQSVNGFFGKYYAKFKNATAEEKNKMVAHYLKSIKDPARQQKEFERLSKAGYTPEETKLLATNTTTMHPKNQVKAAVSVCTNGSEEQKKVASVEVANKLPEFDKTNQKAIAKVIVDTKNEEAIKAGATHAAECDKTAQVEVVKTFEKVENKDVNKILIDQYNKYDVKNQLDIHKTMSSSKLPKTVEYAASKIFLLDKTNQVNAVKITNATGNNFAIMAAAKQIARCERRLMAQLSREINNTDCNAAKEIVENITRNIADTDKQADTDNTTPEASAPTGEDKDDDDSINTATNNVASDDDSEKIDFANSTDAEKISMMSSLSPDELINNLGSFMGQNASPEVINAAISMLKSNISSQDAGKVLGLVQNSQYAQNAILTQLASLDPVTQSFVVKTAADSGSLDKINRDLLSQPAKIEYDKLTEQQNKHK